MPLDATMLSLLHLGTLSLFFCTSTGTIYRDLAQNSQCVSNAGCNQLDLAGECCPTIDGIHLHCCDEDVSLPPNNEPSGTPVLRSQCSSNPECERLELEGSCCPTIDGVFLHCCENNLAVEPTKLPTNMPMSTNEPSSEAPVVSTQNPTSPEPTVNPVNSPTSKPTTSPTSKPSDAVPSNPTTNITPTNLPTISPVPVSTPNPSTSEPTHAPTTEPTNAPTSIPSEALPTNPTTNEPTSRPSVNNPTESPPSELTNSPTESPTEPPTESPFESPTESPIISPIAPSVGSRVGQPVDFDSTPNVIVFDPSISISAIQAKFDEIWTNQRNNEMGTERYSLLFLPGVYGTNEQPLQIKIGYYTEVAGLGSTPEDVVINGKVEVYNRCFVPDTYEEGKFIPADSESGLCFALNNFWRSLSNLSIKVNSKGQESCRATANFWAISQAASMRRVNIEGGELSLMDYCSQPAFASGGFIADSRAGIIRNGSQQQWISRNLEIDEWSGSVWNQVFTGVVNAPDDSDFPSLGSRFTTIDKTPLSREKPFIFFDGSTYNVFAPFAFTETSGVSWSDGTLTSGRTIPITDFFIAKPADSVEVINFALNQGKHLIFAPGVYEIEESINVERENTVVLGLGIATLTAFSGAIPMRISNKPGIIVAGVTIDAGADESPVLLQVGAPGSDEETLETDSTNPTTLNDVYFRVGGPHIGKTDVALEINSNNVLIDHTWVWRGDHGVEDFDTNDGFEGDNERWRTNIGRNGVVVNGNDVTAIGLFVEHFQEYNLIWNGDGGRVYLFQNELPYEPPTQDDWKTPEGTLGYAGYKVDDAVTTHTLWSGGVYCYNRNNPTVETAMGYEVPDKPGVVLNRIMTKNLSGPGVILSVVNGFGARVDDINDGPSFVTKYSDGIATGVAIAAPSISAINEQHSSQSKDNGRINSIVIPIAAISAFTLIAMAIVFQRKHRTNNETTNVQAKSLDLPDGDSSFASSEDTEAEDESTGETADENGVEVAYAP